MPLRAQRSAVFPADLFTGEAEVPGAWWVIHTRPRSEKALGDRMERAGVAHFLPQYAKRLNAGGKQRTSYLPLFPGYFFLKGSPEDRTRALETNLVAGCLPVPDQETLDRQLAQVYRVMTNDPAACRPEADARVGTLVEVTGGPFAGLTGRVVEVSGGYRFVVEVEFIGRGVAVPLDHWMFRRIG